MDSLGAFARGSASRGSRIRVFDWHKAAALIAERKPTCAGAVLEDDWEWTGGDIYRDGTIVDAHCTYVYLASTWATPLLSLDGDEIECWLFADETPGWDAETYWPETARAILVAGAAS